MKRLITTLIVVLILELVGFSQTKKHILYKQLNQTSLYVDVIYPKEFKQGTPRPAIVFFLVVAGLRVT
jgi:hypothetical protein